MKRLVVIFSAMLILVGCTQVLSSTAPPPAEPEAANAAEAYTVNLNPADFVDVIDNPYFPQIPGTKRIYEGKTEDGLERIEIEILAETRPVMGIDATVVRDTVYLDGELIEDTFDWFAQDNAGNVWYFGEDVKNYKDGKLVDTTDGSWEAGVDGALPGIVMFGSPAAHIGETYRQEYYQGEAEDMADLLSATESVTIPFGSFDNVVQTKDYTPLEPGIFEHKFYAEGIGVIKEVNLETGEEIVLVEVLLSEQSDSGSAAPAVQQVTTCADDDDDEQEADGEAEDSDDCEDDDTNKSGEADDDDDSELEDDDDDDDDGSEANDLANTSPCVPAQGEGNITPLKNTKMIIEHNATDEDTGFQGFIDSEGWKCLVFSGPEGAVLTLNGQGKLGDLGLTELFFETVEPANADISIADMLAVLPEGSYTIEGPAIEAGENKGQTGGIAWLTHNIPVGPVLLSPKEDAAVSANEALVVSWEPVTKTIDGSEVKLIAYQLIIEKDEEPYPHMIGKFGLSMYLPASITSITIPQGFLEPATAYSWEVLAIEESGNQTLSSSSFSTQ